MLSRLRSTSRGAGWCGRLLRTRAREQRPVQDGEFRPPGWIGDGDREETGILVVHAVGVDAGVVVRECREPQALPVEEVLRYGEGDARAFGAHSAEFARSFRSEFATSVHGFGPPLGGRVSGRREASVHPLESRLLSLRVCVVSHGFSGHRMSPRRWAWMQGRSDAATRRAARAGEHREGGDRGSHRPPSVRPGPRASERSAAGS